MTVADYIAYLQGFDAKDLITEVLATHANGIRRSMSATYNARPMTLAVRVVKPDPQVEYAETVLIKAREVAKSATDYKGLFAGLKAIVEHHYPTAESRAAFAGTLQLQALRNILTEGMHRFDIFGRDNLVEETA